MYDINYRMALLVCLQITLKHGRQLPNSSDHVTLHAVALRRAVTAAQIYVVEAQGDIDAENMLCPSLHNTPRALPTNVAYFEATGQVTS